MIALLRKAVELRPGFKDAQLALAIALYNQRFFEQAIASLTTVQQLDHAEALRMYRILAYSYNELDQKEDARKSAELLRDISRTPEEIAIADELMRHVSQPPQPSREESAVVAGSEASEGEPEEESARTFGGEERPRLVRRAAPESSFTERVAPKPTATIEGTLYQFDCLGDVARLTILYSGRRVAFAILEPNTVKITGAESGTLDFSCGRQQPIPVVIEFEDKLDGALGTTGIVRAIEFK